MVFFTPNEGRHFSKYFKTLGYVTGNSAYDLKVNQKQHIIWSTTSEEHSRPGLGLNMNFGRWKYLKEYAFGIHEKHMDHLPLVIHRNLKGCVEILNCTVVIENNQNNL